MNQLGIGFIAWAPDYNNPKYTAAAAALIPSGTTFEMSSIGGKRSMERIQQEIAAVEQYLGWLKSELSGHPDYRRSPPTSAAEPK
jgi:hypothetical protein